MATGFAYNVNRSRSIFSAPSYEMVRRARPHVVDNIRAAHQSNLMFSEATGTSLRCVVYAAINKTNNKIYVGMTGSGLETRSRQHINSARSGSSKGIFSSALRKYGKESFEFFIVSICRNIEEADEKEKDAIDAIRPEYNMTSGGGGQHGYVRSDEQKKKMASARRLWWGKNRDNEGYLQTIRKVAIAAGKLRSRSVVCVSDGNRRFASQHDAARFYGIDSRSVYRSCKNPNRKRRTAHKFRYAE